MPPNPTPYYPTHEDCQYDAVRRSAYESHESGTSDKQPKIDSKAKGARGEIALAKILSARFNQIFSRSVGSGNRWSQVASLPKHAQETYTGDLVCPAGFKWTIECKVGYDEIDLGSLQPNKTLDGFLAQAATDASMSGRKPLVAFKRARQPWVAAIPATTFLVPSEPHQHYLLYRGWWIFPLTELLGLSDEFWLG